MFKSSSDFLILRDSQKFQNAVKSAVSKVQMFKNQGARTKNQETVKIISIQIILIGFISPGKAN